MKPAPRGASQADQCLQILEIPDAPVAPRAHGVELNGNAPQPSAVADGIGLIAVRRRHHQRTAMRRAGADLDFELMSTRRKLERQLQAAASDPGALDLAAPELRTIGRRHDARAPLAALQVHRPQEPCAEVAGGNVEIHARARPMRGDDRGQERSAALGVESAHLGRERDGIVHRATHGAQNVGLGFQAEVAQLAAIIVVRIADAAQPGEWFDQVRVQLNTPEKRRCWEPTETPRRPRAPAPRWSCSPYRSAVSTGCRRAAQAT